MAPSTLLVCTTPEVAKGWPGCQESGLSQMFVLPAVPAFNVDVEGRWEVMRGRRCRPALTETTRAGSEVQGRVGISGRSVDAVSPAASLLPRRTELPCIQVTSLPGPLDGSGGRLVYLGSSPVPALRSLPSALRLRRNDLTSHLSCSQAGAPSNAVPACCRPRASASQPRCCPCPHRVSSLPSIPMQSQCAPSAITADVSPPQCRPQCAGALATTSSKPCYEPSTPSSLESQAPSTARWRLRPRLECKPLRKKCRSPTARVPPPCSVSLHPIAITRTVRLLALLLPPFPIHPNLPSISTRTHPPARAVESHTVLPSIDIILPGRQCNWPCSCRLDSRAVHCTTECTLVSAGRTRAGVFLHSDR